MPLRPEYKTKRVSDLLVRDKLLAASQLEAVLDHVQASGDRIEETIVEMGLVKEADLLKSLATYYKVYFISSEKLAKAEVARALLNMIPKAFAEKIGVCPVRFEASTHTLSVVTADPDDHEALEEAQLASGAREVKAILARPAAVKALTAKVYSGDLHAFALLDRQAHEQLSAMVDAQHHRNVAGDVSHAAHPELRMPRERMISEADMARGAQAAAAPAASTTKPSAVGHAAPKPAAPKAPMPPPPAMPAVEPISAPLELLNVLVSLLEGSRADLRGHSAHVARLTRRVAEKMKLGPDAAAALVAAAYVHDLGKMAQFHLTTLNCSEYDGHKTAAQKAYAVPARLLESVRMPAETMQAVEHMYERYDGKGFPDETSGKDIPLAARVLAICDTYADLVQNPRNPFRKALSPQEACGGIAKYAGTIFDPNLVDLFKNTMLGEDLKARLLANRSQALVVDTDPEETTVLELRLIEQGFVVHTARSAEQALEELAAGETDLVVSEIELGGSNGLDLLAQARKEAWGTQLPWVIYTRKQERAIAQRAFDLGVLDYVTKPAHTDVLVAKLKALLDQRAASRASRGVSGSLREMSLPDMVQVLFHGRKSGMLKITTRERDGEIHLADGSIVDAVWGDLRGDGAVYAMLKLRDGEFSLDPTFKAQARTIHVSGEALLLEGMRRMDEGIG